MAVFEEMVPRIKVQAEVVHHVTDHIQAKVLITLKKVTETRREILETTNLEIVKNILVSFVIYLII